MTIVGFLDKVKEQAATASAVAKDAAQKGQAKLDEIQNKRAADALLRDLGAAVYAEQTGRSTATTTEDVERLAGALHAHEEANGPIDLELTAVPGKSAPWPPPSPGSTATSAPEDPPATAGEPTS